MALPPEDAEPTTPGAAIVEAAALAEVAAPDRVPAGPPDTGRPGPPDRGTDPDPIATSDGQARQLAALTKALGQSARKAGVKEVASGHWLAETVIDASTHLPIRERSTLQAHHPGLAGPDLAEVLIRNASRSTAAVGAAAGALMGAEALLPPSWIALPFELLVETAAIAAIEMKLIGELHEAFGLPVPGPPLERGYALARAWAERRGVTSAILKEGIPALGDSLGRGARNELLRILRRRLWRRAGANLASLGPLMIGGAAGAAVNRRSTRRLGQAVVGSLVRPPR